MAEEVQAVAAEPQKASAEETAKAQEAAESARPRDRGADGKFKGLLSAFMEGGKDSIGNPAEPEEPKPNFNEPKEEDDAPVPEMKPVKVKPPTPPKKEEVEDAEPEPEEPAEEEESDHEDDETPRQKPKLTPAQESAIKAFAKRFDLPEGLDETADARDHALDRFNRLTEE